MQDFINQWSGKPADFDGYYGPQCVDLAQYWSRSLGGPKFWGDAIDIARQADGFYDWIPNTPTAVPAAGDIVVWGQNPSIGTGPAGHVAIANGEGDTSWFHSFDQNWPVGSLPHIQWHNYNGVLGWLRKKPVGTQEVKMFTSPVNGDARDAQGWYSAYAERNNQWVALVSQDSDKDAQINSLLGQIAGLQAQVAALSRQVPSVTQVEIQPEYRATYQSVPNPYIATTKQESFALDMTSKGGPQRVPVGTPVEVAGEFIDNGKPYVRSQLSVDAEKDPNNPLFGTFYGLPKSAFDDIHEVPIMDNPNIDEAIAAPLQHNTVAMTWANMLGPLLRFSKVVVNRFKLTRN